MFFEMSYDATNGDTRFIETEAKNGFEARKFVAQLPDFRFLISIKPAKFGAPQFKVGDQVRWINDYGLVWPGQIVIEVEQQEDGSFAYYVAPTSSPWFPVKENMMELDPDPLPAKLFHVYVRHREENCDVRMTATPVSLHDGIVLMSKITDYPWRAKLLREAVTVCEIED